MKKILSLILALALALSLAACGSEPERGTVTPERSRTASTAAPEAETPAEEAPAEETPVEETPAEEAPVEETPAEETPAEETPVDGDGLFGDIDGFRYENSSLKIGCLLDDSWTIGSEEDLAALVGMTADMFQDSSYREQMLNADMFYDFYASADEGMRTINILFQNLGVTGALMSEEAYRSASQTNVDEQLASAGFTDVQAEEVTVYFAGADRVGLRMSAKIQGIDYYTTQVFIKDGGYIACITLGSLQENHNDETAALFYGLD